MDKKGAPKCHNCGADASAPPKMGRDFQNRNRNLEALDLDSIKISTLSLDDPSWEAKLSGKTGSTYNATAAAKEGQWGELKGNLECFVRHLDNFVAKYPGTGLEDCKKFKVLKKTLATFGDEVTSEQLSRVGSIIKMTFDLCLPPEIDEKDIAPLIDEAKKLEEKVRDGVVYNIIACAKAGKAVTVNFRIFD